MLEVQHSESVDGHYCPAGQYRNWCSRLHAGILFFPSDSPGPAVAAEAPVLEPTPVFSRTAGSFPQTVRFRSRVNDADR